MEIATMVIVWLGILWIYFIVKDISNDIRYFRAVSVENLFSLEKRLHIVEDVLRRIEDKQIISNYMPIGDLTTLPHFSEEDQKKRRLEAALTKARIEAEERINSE